jgi:hypothetical protein
MTAETSELTEMPTTPEGRRALAIKRIKAKDEFKIHLVVYLCVNGMLTLIWALTSVGTPFLGGFFWPIIPMAGWGIGLVIHAFTAYRTNVYTEEQVQREMRQLTQ